MEVSGRRLKGFYGRELQMSVSPQEDEKSVSIENPELISYYSCVLSTVAISLSVQADVSVLDLALAININVSLNIKR